MMIGQFLDYLRYERNKSPLTVQSYGEDLRAFETYFKIWIVISLGSRLMPTLSETGWRV